MPYTPTSWVSGTTPVDAPEMNNLETQWQEAVLSVPGEEYAPFVEYGLVCTKDGTTANKLDVTTGIAWMIQPGTYELRERVLNATSFLTTIASTTYFLDFNPDGTTSWATTHSGVANALNICSVTTDASANINVVTDLRGTVINVWPFSVGAYRVRGLNVTFLQSNGGGAAGTNLWVGTTDPGGLAGEGDVWVKG